MPKLTKRVVDGLKPRKATEVFVWDSEVKGPGIRIKPSGTRSYLIQYRNQARRTRRMVPGRCSQRRKPCGWPGNLLRRAAWRGVDSRGELVNGVPRLVAGLAILVHRSPHADCRRTLFAIEVVVFAKGVMGDARWFGRCIRMCLGRAQTHGRKSAHPNHAPMRQRGQ